MEQLLKIRLLVLASTDNRCQSYPLCLPDLKDKHFLKNFQPIDVDMFLAQTVRFYGFSMF